MTPRHSKRRRMCSATYRNFSQQKLDATRSDWTTSSTKWKHNSIRNVKGTHPNSSIPEPTKNSSSTRAIPAIPLASLFMEQSYRLTQPPTSKTTIASRIGTSRASHSGSECRGRAEPTSCRPTERPTWAEQAYSKYC